MTTEYPPEPSGEACNANEQGEWGGRRTLALWFPQMGGYTSKAVAVDPGCDEEFDDMDVYVWHDGEFPFTEGDRDWEGKPRSPALLHLCDPGQFVGFGQRLLDWGPVRLS